MLDRGGLLVSVCVLKCVQKEQRSIHVSEINESKIYQLAN